MTKGFSNSINIILYNDIESSSKSDWLFVFSLIFMLKLSQTDYFSDSWWSVIVLRESLNLFFMKKFLFDLICEDDR